MAIDLKTFFTVVAKDPLEVRPADVSDFLADQCGDRSVVRIADRESGLSARTIARRLSSVSGFCAYLIARGDTAVAVNPVPGGLRPGARPTDDIFQLPGDGAAVGNHDAVSQVFVDVVPRSAVEEAGPASCPLRLSHGCVFGPPG